MRNAILIAGANGAGKTTFSRQVLQLQYTQTVFLNADEIQRDEVGFGTPVAAGRELLRRLHALAANGNSFAVETTLSSRMYQRLVPEWSQRGYLTTLHFIEVPSVELAIQRVARRVATGGHGIPEEDIRRRYTRGLELFHSTFKPIVDEWFHWTSTDEGVKLVGRNATSRCV